MFSGADPARVAPLTGAIEGVAEDPQGRPLPMHLMLRGTSGRVVKQATSRPDGRYRFAGITAGDYSISGVKRSFLNNEGGAVQLLSRPENVTDQLGPHGTGTDKDRVGDRPHAVAMQEVGLARDPAGFAVLGCNSGVEALPDMSDGEPPGREKQ